MTLSFSGDVKASDAAVHPLPLGGAVAADPAAQMEDCFVWVPEDGLLIAAAGVGLADGHIEQYVDAAILAHTMAGAVAGFASRQPVATANIVPTSAFDPVQRAWSTTADRSRPPLLTDALAAAAALLPQQLSASQAMHHRGTGVELAALKFLADGTVEIAQAGAFAVYRHRRGRLERIVQCGTLGDDNPDPAKVGDGLAHVITRLVSSDGSIGGGIFATTTNYLPGDRFLVVTRGARPHLSDREIDNCMADDPSQIVAAVLATARRSQLSSVRTSSVRTSGARLRSAQPSSGHFSAAAIAVA